MSGTIRKTNKEREDLTIQGIQYGLTDLYRTLHPTTAANILSSVHHSPEKIT